jgi:alcohol dehydrogenase YqhD (iron-dependent ADH family)
MADQELTEEQFFFLKGILQQGTFVILVPSMLEGDPEDVKASHAKFSKDVLSLVEKGFMKDISESYAELSASLREQGVKRTVTGYAVTETAIHMFLPPEGRAN